MQPSPLWQQLEGVILYTGRRDHVQPNPSTKAHLHAAQDHQHNHTQEGRVFYEDQVL